MTTTTDKALKRPPGYGLTRVDQQSKHNHGYNVRIAYRGQRWSKWFADGGDRSRAHREAQAYATEVFDSLPIERRQQIIELAQRGAPEQSGVTGVTKSDRNVRGCRYHYWRASWMRDGKRCIKDFSVQKHGNIEAKRLAIEERGRHA